MPSSPPPGSPCVCVASAGVWMGSGRGASSPSESAVPCGIFRHVFLWVAVLTVSASGDLPGVTVLLTRAVGSRVCSGVWKSSSKPTRSSRNWAFSSLVLLHFLLLLTFSTRSSFFLGVSLDNLMSSSPPPGSLWEGTLSPGARVGFLRAEGSSSRSTFWGGVLSCLLLVGLWTGSASGDLPGPVVVLSSAIGLSVWFGVWKSSLRPARSSNDGAFLLGVLDRLLLPVTFSAGVVFCFGVSLNNRMSSSPLPGSRCVCALSPGVWVRFLRSFSRSPFRGGVLSCFLLLVGVLTGSASGDLQGTLVVLSLVIGLSVWFGVWKSSLRPTRSSKDWTFFLGVLDRPLFPVTFSA
ncbi:unnamed protein product, partial [Gulo gulo]